MQTDKFFTVIVKVALYKDLENFQYLELKTHNFVITKDIAKHDVPNERRRNKLELNSTLNTIPYKN